MNSFNYESATSFSDAIQKKDSPDNRFLAGGTTLIDLMKCGVEHPGKLVNILDIPVSHSVTFLKETIHIDALAHMADLENHPDCQQFAPAIYGSLWQAASPQIRNMATIGGNLRQRTRCVYFRDPGSNAPCNKRTPGTGCAALEGLNRNHAILGGSDQCVAVYPGDLAVALTAFDARVHLLSSAGSTRKVSINAFYLLPDKTPHLEHDIRTDEIITAVEVDRIPALQHSHYLKIRDRSSYEFAATSVAAGIEVRRGVIGDVRIALGGVGTKPWRAYEVETALKGKPFNKENLTTAANLITANARPLKDNGFKVTLAPKAIVRALLIAGGQS